MSARIVMLGPVRDRKLLACEVSPMAAGAFLSGGNWRVSLTLWGGVLENATVLVPDRQNEWDTWPESMGGKGATDEGKGLGDPVGGKVRGQDLGWSMLADAPAWETGPEFEVEIPVPVGVSL